MQQVFEGVGHCQQFLGGGFAPDRRQTSSHRYCTGLETSGVPVGAGLPAMGRTAAPMQVIKGYDYAASR
ncbi:hypothetical protein D0894_20075 [Pseudomonas monteilii]|uniref:Uncharacterized protein n=1 Tax=Pseudomonas monteilii TaxID=76759 RepID=A0A399M1Z2_9PSED|nr:hypothetical protein D0894_20075 [Pseudomonas monteilii]